VGGLTGRMRGRTAALQRKPMLTNVLQPAGPEGVWARSRGAGY
jgi:hypothetical protein